jgi:hypothetical protein
VISGTIEFKSPASRTSSTSIWRNFVASLSLALILKTFWFFQGLLFMSLDGLSTSLFFFRIGICRHGLVWWNGWLVAC